LSKEDEELAKIIQDTGLTREQLLRVADIPWHEGANRKSFVLGEPLMWPQMVDISCQQKCVYCIIGTWSNLKKDVRCSLLLSMIAIFLGGEDDLWIEFESLWFFNNQDAVDKS
jgi:hypothetical protein